MRRDRSKWPVSAAGHELRAPLAIISGYAELLRVRGDEKTRLEASAHIQAAAERLSRCLDDVLLLFGLAAGEVKAEPTPILLVPVVRAAAADVAFDHPGHALDVRADDEEIQVVADVVQLPRMISSLLAGLCAAQPRGGDVTVRLEHPRASAALVGETSQPWRPNEAALLKLEAARRLAELQGGSLSVKPESDPATVTLTLPLEGQRAGRGLTQRLMIVDDDDSLRRLLVLTLPSEGFEIVEARDGSEALSRAQRDAPDLVVLDWRLPDCSGEKVLRELLRERPGLPVIVLTAEQERTREVAASLGARAFLTKPFSPIELLDCVERLLAQPRAGAHAGG